MSIPSMQELAALGPGAGPHQDAGDGAAGAPAYRLEQARELLLAVGYVLTEAGGYARADDIGVTP